MNQQELTNIFCSRPQNFAWLLGAGASRTAGLPTAEDVIWDMKRRYYCREENQDISRHDIQNPAVRSCIQSFVDSKGFPGRWTENEYSTYFEKIFGKDDERQRKYLKAILTEDKITLSVGNRVLGALLSSQLCRLVFTTNFDTVVEKAVAEVSGQSISAYHLEGSHVANEALNNEEFPIYCKLHGDFRYDSLKNLPEALKTQNAELSKCLMNAGNRFGFIVAGYSGRDKSVMNLFHEVLKSSNPFPHGLFWVGIKGSEIPPSADNLLRAASDAGVNAQYIPIETYDAFMLRLWRNVEDKPGNINSKVQKSSYSSVDIELPASGSAKPIMRLNALPLASLPNKCLKLNFNKPMDVAEVQKVESDFRESLIITKNEPFYCWGTREKIQKAYGYALSEIETVELPTKLDLPENLNLKGFFGDALCKALIKGRPLLFRARSSSAWIIADPHSSDKSSLDPLFNVIGKESGMIPGLFTLVTEENPTAEEVSWSEGIKVSIEIKNGRLWLLIDPDIWIWPPRARKRAIDFLDDRRANRYNNIYNQLLDAWVKVIFDFDGTKHQVDVSTFSHGNDEENPSFRIFRRTAFSRRSGT